MQKMKFVLSDESVNAYGFRIQTKGIDLERFKRNPVMFFAHESWSLPIGRWENLEVTPDGKLLGEPVFDEKDPFAVQVMQKAESGILSAVSIGIAALEWSNENLAPGQSRPTITKSELLECSFVGIPANRNAVKLSLAQNIPSEILNILQNEQHQAKKGFSIFNSLFPTSKASEQESRQREYHLEANLEALGRKVETLQAENERIVNDFTAKLDLAAKENDAFRAKIQTLENQNEALSNQILSMQGNPVKVGHERSPGDRDDNLAFFGRTDVDDEYNRLRDSRNR